MTEAIALDSRQFALDLLAFLKAIDPAQWQKDLEQSFQAQIQNMRQRIDALLQRWPEGDLTPLRTGLTELSEVLEQKPTQTEQWLSFRKKLSAAYESLAAALRAQRLPVPSLRPTNYTRNLFHVGSGLGTLMLIEHVLSPTMMLVVAGSAAFMGWSMEIARRYSPAANRALMWLFGPVAHPHEAKGINSATWYTSALFLIALLFSPLMCAIAVTVLAFGDPAAALIGRRWGRTKLVNGRSLEGSLGFVVVGSAATAIMLFLGHPELSVVSTLALSAGAGLVGAVAELLTRRLDDNLAVPLAAAAGAKLTALLFSLPVL